MDWFLSFAAAIFALAFGNSMLAANTRRTVAVSAGRKHSQTGEPLTNFPARQRIIGMIIVIAGGLAFVALSFLWASNANLPY